MKKIFTLVLVLVLAVSAMFVFTACGEEPEVEPIVEETYYKVTYVYKNGDKTVELSTQQVSETAGFSAEQVAAIEKFSNNGYGFAAWYADEDCTVPFDFTAKLTADTTVYASRGNVAGYGVEWIVSYTNDGFAIVFTGNGAMYDYDNASDAPWADIAPLVRSVSFSEGITKIGNNTCTGMTALDVVLVPKSVKTVGINAFANSGLSQVVFLNGTKTIGANAFADCANLALVILPESLETVAANAFYNAPKLQQFAFMGNDLSAELTETKNFKFVEKCLIDVANKTLLATTVATEVVVDDSVENIAPGAFLNKTTLTKVVLSKNLKTIGDNAFNGCKALAQVSSSEKDNSEILVNNVAAVFSLPSGVTTMGASAFANCSALVGPVVLPEGLTAIPDGCFYHCIEISAIVIPKSVTNVGPTAFKVPDNNGGYRNLMLKYAYYTGTEAEWNAVEKGVDNYRLFDKALFFFYSEEAPEAAGPYWHYAEDEDGNDLGIRQWYFAIRYATVSPNNAAQLLFLFNDYVEVDQETYTATLTTANKEYMDNIEVNGYKYGGFYLVDNHAWTNANKTDIKNNFAKLTFVYEGEDATALTNNVWIGALRSNILSADGGITYTTGTAATISKAADTATKTYVTETFDYASLTDAQFVWNAAATGSNKGNTARRRDVVTSVTIKTDANGNGGITYFGAYSLANYSMAELVLPKDVESVHYKFVDNCGKLKNIYYQGTSALKIVDDEGNEVTALNQNGVTIYTKFVDGQTDVTKNGAYWTEIDGKKVVWNFQDGALSIGGATEMPDFATAADAPWADANITSVSFDAGITKIGQNVLNGDASVATIKLPSSVKVIPANAFEGTAAITNLAAAADGCGYIDGHLIKVVDASKIGTRFDVSRNTYSIAEGAFDGVTALKEIYIVRNVIYVAADAFDGTSLETVYYDGLPATWANIAKDFDSTIDVYFQTINTPTIANWTNYNWFTIATEPDASGFRKIAAYDDENYVTVTFESEGAKVAEVVYIDGIGGAISVAQPTKAGYKFAGWADEDGNVYAKVTAELLADGDVTLTAKFTK